MNNGSYTRNQQKQFVLISYSGFVSKNKGCTYLPNGR